MKYPKGKIIELATGSKNKNIGDLYEGINGFKKGYKPRTNLVNDEKGGITVYVQWAPTVCYTF
jgi:hypothetical protein